MKNQLISIIFILSAIVTFSQNFEGTITYITDFEVSPKMIEKGLTKEVLLEKMKNDGLNFDTIFISYKNGSYYKYSTNKLKTWSLYTDSSQNIYTVSNGIENEICTITNANLDTEYAYYNIMPTVIKLDTIVAVNGIDCSIARVKWKSGYYDYYFNSDILKTDPKLFSHHVYDGFYEFLKISNSLPIKIVKYGGSSMTTTETLINFNQESIDNKVFYIPNLIDDKSLNYVKIPNRKTMRIIK
jgi:hypothetical protein